MAFIHVNGEDFVLVSKERVFIYSIRPQLSSSIEFPELVKKTTETNDELQENDQNPKLASAESVNSVTCSTISNCGDFVAVADSEKRLMVWQKKSENWTLIHNWTTIRKCIKIKLTNSSKYLLAADRAGDVYLYSLTEQDRQQGSLILGHLSMLLDLVISSDDRFVITSDRDEKIRVSNFPKAYNIENYCLGHTEFVTCIALCGLHKQWLISGSGDGTLRIWKYDEGIELSSLNYTEYLNFDGNKDAVTCNKVPAVKSLHISETSQYIAAFFDRVSCCSIFKLSQNGSIPQLEHMQNFKFSIEPWDAAFDKDDKLIVLLPEEGKTISIYKPLNHNSVTRWENELSSELGIFVNSKWNELKDLIGANNFTQTLYKQWYDNVEMYMEKKKIRQEKKFKKLKINT